MNGVRNVGSVIGMHEYLIPSIQTTLSGEITRATQSETVLQNHIDLEAAARALADNAHTAQIAQEVSDRQTAVFQLQSGLTSESSTRAAADLVLTNGLAQTNIDLATESKAARAAEAKIASDLSTESKL